MSGGFKEQPGGLRGWSTVSEGERNSRAGQGRKGEGRSL